MTAAAYVRVSSASQTHAMQRDAIERAARARGDEGLTWYADTFTGATTKRHALESLRERLRFGDHPRVYVYRLDRLTRSGIRDMLTLVEEFRRHGAELVSIADGFDLNGPASEIVLAVLAWAAQMERQAIGERIATARERARAKGTPWGRPTRMTKQDIERARAYRAEGKSMRWIAAAMKIPRPTLQRSLARKPKPKDRAKVLTR